MPNQWDYYSMVGFQPETNLPEDLERLTIDDDETALFLDFDGTLVDIAPTPDAIEVDDELKFLLDDLLQRHGGAVAIVSGRNLQVIDHYLDGFAGTVSGGHGAELRHGAEHQGGIECDFERLDHIKTAVREFAIIDPRIMAEDKSFGIVLHFRQHPDLECKVREFFHSLVGDDEQFEIQAAKMALEIKPRGVSKADAIERIAEFTDFSGRKILFAGDDTTDETAFCWVNKKGGITVKIGEGPTCARYRTHSPATFRSWLGKRAQAGGC